MPGREQRQLTNGRANPRDEFTATFMPHLNNMLGSVATLPAPGEVPMVQEVSDDGCRAAGTGRTSELEERLALGLSVDAVDSVRGCTLLMHAVLGSQLECIELLLSQEPRLDIEARSSSGDTALILASLCGRAEGVELLLRAGASKLATGASGLTALQCAETSQQGVNNLQPGKEAVARLLQKEDRQQELAALTKRQLRQHATTIGVPADAIQDAQDGPTPKADLISLIVARGANG